MTTTTLRQPRGWHYRELLSTGVEHYQDLLELGTESYQLQCGHYVSLGTYACEDCNYAPLTEWLELRERLFELVDLFGDRVRLSRDEKKALDKARKLLERLD